MVQWDVAELATRTGIDVTAILRAEKVEGTPSITLFQAGIIQQAFEHAGVRFGRGGGVLRAAGKE